MQNLQYAIFFPLYNGRGGKNNHINYTQLRARTWPQDSYNDKIVLACFPLIVHALLIQKKWPTCLCGKLFSVVYIVVSFCYYWDMVAAAGFFPTLTVGCEWFCGSSLWFPTGKTRQTCAGTKKSKGTKPLDAPNLHRHPPPPEKKNSN